MPLNTATLKSTIKSSMLANLPSPTSGQMSEVDTLAGNIANAIETFVLGLTITTAPVTGLAAPPSGGPVTGALIYTLS